jgi:phenylalanyl-tRNA synthetase beta subunit
MTRPRGPRAEPSPRPRGITSAWWPPRLSPAAGAAIRWRATSTLSVLCSRPCWPLPGCRNAGPPGWIGELHPLVIRAWELAAPATAFELDVGALDTLTAGQVATYRDVTGFPAVLQDIAVVVDEDVSAAEVEGAVRAGGGELLAGVEVFDLYRGDQVGDGRKSLALRLEFRARDRTLTDDEVAELRSAIERELQEIGGSLRA